jgi:inner membrane protein
MPTIFTHAVVAYALSKLFLEATEERSGAVGIEQALPDTDRQSSPWATAGNRAILLAAGILGALPDVDALYRDWVVHRDLFGHRGLTHSIFFAVFVGLILALLFVKLGWHNRQKVWALAISFVVATASHGFFDAMTTGGSGVGFFAPFETRRYFFPIRPIPVAPFSAADLFSARGLNLFIWEFALLWTFAIGAVIWHRGNLPRKLAAVAFWSVCLAMWVLKGWN